MRLRSYLVVLVLAAVLPMLAFAAIMFRQHSQLQRDAISRGLLDTARALSLAVDREVGTVRAVLETLAASPYLDAKDFKAFHTQSVRALAAQPPGNRIILFDTSGQQIVNTARPFGTPLPNPLREAAPRRTDERYPDLPLGGARYVTKALAGEFVVSDRREDLITTAALGSCVAVCLWDPAAGVAGLLHFLLPDSKINPARAQVAPASFADAGIPLLFQAAYALGAQKKFLAQLKYVAGKESDGAGGRLSDLRACGRYRRSPACHEHGVANGARRSFLPAGIGSPGRRVDASVWCSQPRAGGRRCPGRLLPRVGSVALPRCPGESVGLADDHGQASRD